MRGDLLKPPISPPIAACGQVKRQNQTLSANPSSPARKRPLSRRLIAPGSVSLLACESHHAIWDVSHTSASKAAARILGCLTAVFNNRQQYDNSCDRPRQSCPGRSSSFCILIIHSPPLPAATPVNDISSPILLSSPGRPSDPGASCPVPDVLPQTGSLQLLPGDDEVTGEEDRKGSSP